MVECLTRDQEAVDSSLTSVTVLCPLARHINSSLVLVQPRKTCPYITERLLMGRKESNQAKKAGGLSNYIPVILQKPAIIGPPSCPTKGCNSLSKPLASQVEFILIDCHKMKIETSY